MSVIQTDMADGVNMAPRTDRQSITLFGMVALIVLFGVGGFWAATAPLSGAILATGSVSVIGHSKTIQHLDGGVIASIKVEDGATVGKNDIVIQLDETLLKANLNIYTNRLQEAVAVRSRLIAERDGSETIDWQSNYLDFVGLLSAQAVQIAQFELFIARKETRLGYATQLREQIDQFQNQLSGIRAQRESIGQQRLLLEVELSHSQQLRDKGITTESAVRNLQRELAILQGQAGDAEAEEARIENAINEVDIQILQAGREFQQAVLTELAQTELEIQDMTQQLLATRTQLDRTNIRAPISGVVHELAVFTVGGVISPGMPIMQIVPAHGELEVEVAIEPRFIDEVFVGQPVAVRFSAFNQRTTPQLDGLIKSVSPATIVNKDSGVSYYQAKVAFTDEELERLGTLVLVPGMPVEVHVKTGDRTALNYLFKPLTDQLSRALRED